MNKNIPTFDDITATLARIAKMHEEFAKEFAKGQAENTKRHEEFAKEFDKVQVENTKRQAESTKRHDDLERLISEIARESDKEMKKLRKEIGSIGGSNGEVAVDLVFNKLKKKKTFGGVTFDKIWREIRRRKNDKNGNELDGEYDIIMLNGSAVTLIDVKYRVRRGDLDYLLDVQLPKFKVLFPEYRRSKAYLGLAGMSFAEGVVSLVKRHGVGVIQMDENIVRIDDKGVEAK